MGVCKLRNEDTLFRYMNFNKFMDLVENKYLYFPRADRFEDKHEGYYTKLVYELGEHISILVDGKSRTDGLFENTRIIKGRSYVSCWTRSQHENMAHWKIYGGKNSIAILSSVGELRKQFVDNSKHQIASKYMRRIIEPIEYIDHHSIDEVLAKELLGDILNPLKKKNLAYRYEEEVRIIYDHLQHNSSELSKKLGDGLMVSINFEKLIHNIVVSPEADEWFFCLVSKLMEDYGMQDKIKWSVLRVTPFEQVRSANRSKAENGVCGSTNNHD